MDNSNAPRSTLLSEDKFRFSGKNLALTYTGHLPKADLYNDIVDQYQGTNCRICHETGATGYDHTHVLIMFDCKVDIKNCRKFDFLTEEGETIHPNFQKITTIAHLNAWRKYINKEDPNPYGDLPAAKATQEELFEAATDYVVGCKKWQHVFRAEDTAVKMLICNKITYFKMLWETNSQKPSTTTQHTIYNRAKLDFSTHNWLICGMAGSGKTHYALSHFKNATLVSHIDDLKKITEETDGLVFDDMAFNQWPPGSIIHLLDREQDRSIHARYTNAEIPAKLPKIFTSNREDIFVPNTCTCEEQAGIDRRFKTLKISAKLF